LIALILDGNQRRAAKQATLGEYEETVVVHLDSVVSKDVLLEIAQLLDMDLSSIAPRGRSGPRERGGCVLRELPEAGYLSPFHNHSTAFQRLASFTFLLLPSSSWNTSIMNSF